MSQSIRCGDDEFLIDPARATLTADVREDRATVNWLIEIDSSDEYSPDNMVSIQSPHIALLSGNWRDLESCVFQFPAFTEPLNEFNCGNLYYAGEHEATFKHEIRFLSRNGPCFTIEWSCTAGYRPDYCMDVLTKCEIVFQKVVVSSKLAFSLDRAIDLLGVYFRLDDFVMESQLTGSDYHFFRLKEDII